MSIRSGHLGSRGRTVGGYGIHVPEHVERAPLDLAAIEAWTDANQRARAAYKADQAVAEGLCCKCATNAISFPRRTCQECAGTSRAAKRCAA
ncbi:MAG: hypothetical protein JWO15_3887 [Sphingomonadales bacterium]|nr:hypothetical protein [Sphingomonadales bacterium]